MKEVRIQEITSEQNTLYKAFLKTGLIQGEDNFRISPNDEKDTPFPSKDLDDSFTLGAYIDNKLAGIVSFERDGINREKLRHKGTPFRMYVAPEFRGKGIGKSLIEALLVRVRYLKCVEQINLTVVSTNHLAKRLYDKFGFKTFAVEQNAIKWKGHYFTEEQMVLSTK